MLLRFIAWVAGYTFYLDKNNKIIRRVADDTKFSEKEEWDHPKHFVFRLK